MTASCAVLDFLCLFEHNQTDALATWIELKSVCPALDNRCPGTVPKADVATIALIASLLSSDLLCPPAERLTRALEQPVPKSDSDIPVNEMTAHLLGL